MPFLVRKGVPVHQNLLFDTPEQARGLTRGDLDFRVCRGCEFVFNAAFDPGLLAYGAAYDNSQDSSPFFSEHLDGVVARLADRPEVRDGTVVEVGCGKGRLLQKLLSRPSVRSTAVGFDPSYDGPLSMLGGRLRFEARLFDQESAPDALTAVILRHVIEHVPNPVEFLSSTFEKEPTRTVPLVFVETPCVEWILARRVPWDFFYEHCSLFSARSLAFALRRAGFERAAIDHVFGGQYLWAEAATRAGVVSDVPAERDIASLARGFDSAKLTSRLAKLTREFAAYGPTMVWGAGAKGAAFCDLIDPLGSLLPGIVDLNPAKQGRYLGGTGHPILSPERAVEIGMMVAVVLNPNYTAEVSTLLSQLGARTKIVDLMAEDTGCA